MSIADELDKLNSLQERGVITAEEFQQLKLRLLNGAPAASGSVQAEPSLRRSQDDRWLGGVCGGLAIALGIESWQVRLAFALLFLLWGTGLLVYILLWVFVPKE